MSTSMSRRGLISAGGVALAGATAAALVSAPASAAPPPPSGGSTKGRTLSPGQAHTLTGTPKAGLTYRTVSFMDFTSEQGSHPNGWGGYGVYNSGGDAMHATLELPPGARVRDVEWYAYNTGSTNLVLFARLWTAGSGFLATQVVDTALPPGTGVRAIRVTPPLANAGPYLPGTMLYLISGCDGTSAQQINGCRVGFDLGVGDTGLLTTPVRAYDSRVSGGKLLGGLTRVVTLPASVVKPGMSGVLVTLTATQAAASGYLRAWRTGSAMPASSSLNYTKGMNIANTVVVGVDAARRLSVFSSRSTHFIIDVVGTIG